MEIRNKLQVKRSEKLKQKNNHKHREARKLEKSREIKIVHN